MPSKWSFRKVGRLFTSDTWKVNYTSVVSFVLVLIHSYIFSKPDERPDEKPGERAPEFVEALPEDHEVDEGSEVKLTVRVSGKPKPKLKWMIGSKPLRKSSRVEMRENNGVHELIIRDVTLDDEAVYSCVAMNKFGEAFCDCELLVEGMCWGMGWVRVGDASVG